MNTLHLPAIHNGPAIAGQSDKARQLFDIARLHPEQGRTVMAWNETLAAVARSYAERMARERFFSHVDPQGFGPNHRIRQAGYRLPDNYGDAPAANNCESITAVYNTAQGAWGRWLESAHRVHVLGLIYQFNEQSEIGVGHYELEGSRYGHYWVFLSTHPEPST